VDSGRLIEETRILAESILSGGAIAARYAKEAVNQGADLTLEQGLRLEADLNVLLQSTADRAEGIKSFLERRPPRYTGT
jgi:enoyl-CoA hydratase